MRNEPELIQGPASADDYMHASEGLSPDEEIRRLRGGPEAALADDSAPKYGQGNVLQDGTVRTRRFRSLSPKLRLQMKTTKPKITPEGYWLEGESRYIQFRPYSAGGGYHETNDLEEILVVESAAGYGVDIYDADAMNRQAEDRKADFVEQMVASDPRILERLKAKLGLVDFVAPPEAKQRAESEGEEAEEFEAKPRRRGVR